MDNIQKDDIAQFFDRLDRAQFIDGEMKPLAPLNRPLPIGFGQTISQPTLVREMTQMLELNERCKVLEIGTGSGYQTAFLAEFADEVYTVERIAPLSQGAKKHIEALGYDNVHFRVGDGSEGWEDNAPYDRIITTAAAGKTPQTLIDQLAPGGIMIAPVGPKGCQDLLRMRKDEDGEVHAQSLGKVVFVEMVGEYGWED